MKGLVIKNTGSWFTVRAENGETFESKIKGNFRIKDIRSTSPVAVGDWVELELSPNSPPFITEIHDRKNYIVRRSSNLSKYSHILAANLDLVALVVTVKWPETSTVFIDRFLATAEAYNVPACILINKLDVYDESDFEYAKALKMLYESIGYPVYLVSAIQEDTLKDFRKNLQNKITLISGNSGVGKSTLINALAPDSKAKTNTISHYHKKGIHTTTFSEMFLLPDGGYLIDTPGVKGFGTIDMAENEIGHFFKEIFEVSHQCRFNNCTHTNEPDCAVLKSIDEKKISASRYQSYMSIMEDCKNEKYR